jgi:hypothetical protein
MTTTYLTMKFTTTPSFAHPSVSRIKQTRNATCCFQTQEADVMTLRSSGFMKGQACKYYAEIIGEIQNQSALQNI